MKTSNLQAAGALVRECLASYYMQGSRNEEMRDEKQTRNEKRERRNKFHTAAVLPGQFHYPICNTLS